VDWTCCGPMLCNFLSYASEARKVNYEMVNNKYTAAPEHHLGVEYGNSIHTRIRCFITRIDLRSFSTGR